MHQFGQFAVLYYGSADKIDNSVVTQLCKDQIKDKKVFLDYM